MSATFHGLEIAKSGLTAAQIAVNVANQNVANANTEGYTRQSVNQTSVSAGLGPFQYAPGEVSVGQGVSVSAINQNRDAYLDTRYRNANAVYGTYATTLSALKSVASVLDETDTDGLNVAFADFYSALQDLVSNDSGTEYRSLVRSAGEKVADILNEYASQLEQIEDELHYDLTLSVADLNNLLVKINELNKNISIATVNGTNCNELLDQRNLYLDKVAGYANITVETLLNGSVSITSGGTALLDATTGTVTTLSVGSDAAGAAIFDGGGNKVEFTQGIFKGLLQTMNGKGIYAGAGEESFRGVGYYKTSLDNLAAAFAETYNTLNAANGDLFVTSDGSATVTAANIRISDDWRQSAAYLDTSGTVPTDMKAAMDAATAISSDFTGTFEEYSSLLMGTIGLDTAYYSDMSAAKSSILESIQDDRESISGVSIDEETVNTIVFQKAYQAAARLMTVLDEMLDTLINNMAV
ncbi:MAG TPA: flagellar hook-associated protein FlgK [Terriglobales bacterium]|nr:flagellar hook-associated protein FlgK [Terriglobales bacterium]